MIKSLIASIALSTLACAPQVRATTYTHRDLLNQLESMGGVVYVDSHLCDEVNAYGLQRGHEVHLCTKPHKGNVAEMENTIRHEVWHIVQACYGGPLTDSPAETISGAYKRGWHTHGYKPESWHMEAEAHYVAATRSAKEISNALIKVCS